MEVRPPTTAEEWHAVAELLASGNGLSEHKRRDLERGSGYLGFIAGDGPVVAGYAHVSQSHGSGEWGLEIVTVPGVDLATWSALIAAARRQAGPGRTLNYWPGPAHAAAAASREWEERRRLCRYEAELPLAPSRPAAGITIAAVGTDDHAEIVAVNNRAFADHPEQGGWTVGRIDELRDAAWFDPDGLIGAWDERGLAGFCWTKIHPDGCGEIYIIAVDPRRQGRGVGEHLAAAAMEYVSSKRGARRGMLYVDADNRAARRLYERLGFRVMAESVCYSVPGG
jgi:mycothiol synthase